MRMITRVLFIVVALFVSSLAIDIVIAADEAEQKFLGFHLSGASSSGAKSWEVAGESADIFADVVKLTNIVAKVYGEEEMTLTAREGSLDKQDGTLHLQDNVVASTPSGAKMTTESLDWDRETNTVSNDEFVTIEKETLTATGTGIEARTDMSQAKMKEDVTVEFGSPGDGKDFGKSVVTCDGPLEIDYQNQTAEFYNNVVVKNPEGLMFADYMKIFIDFNTKQLKKIISRGNVKIIRGENTSESEEAIYYADEQRIELKGRPKLTFFTESKPGEENNAPFGN